MFNKTIIDKYFEHQINFEKKYGPKTVVLEEIGSFFEFYGVDNDTEKIGDVKTVAEILNIQMTRRKKSILENNRSNCLMAGFPSPSLKRFLQKLMDVSYTVILIEQVTPPPKPRREITNIYSPGTYIDNIQSGSDTNNLLSIYLEVEEDIKKNVKLHIFGISVIDLTTGKNTVYQTNYQDADKQVIYEDAYRFIESFNPKEIIVNTRGYNGTEDNLIKKINLINRICHIKINDVASTIYKISYQNEFLKRIFRDCNNSFLSPIEYLNLEKKNYALISYILLLEFAYDHNKKIVHNLETPDIWMCNKYLTLNHNSIYQLDIINCSQSDNKFGNVKTRFKSLFDVINQTNTAIGRRYLKNQLLNPIIDEEELEKRYDLISQMIKLDNKSFNTLDKQLNDILDVERLHRRLIIGVLSPHEFANMHYTYESIISIIEILKNNFNLTVFDIDKNDINIFKTYIEEYTKYFKIDEMLKYQLNDIKSSFFNKGIYNDIDILQNKLETYFKNLNIIIEDLSNILMQNGIKQTGNLITLNYTDRDGYVLILTNKRGNILKKLINNENSKYSDLIIKNKSSNAQKISSKKIDKLSDSIILVKEKIRTLVRKKYLIVLEQLEKKYMNIMKKISQFIAKVDFVNSCTKVSIKYGYCRPKIINKDNNNCSFIQSKDMRHPIVERIHDEIEYIPNDVKIGTNSEGIVLFGINGSGKSCYMKSIGLNLVLAQMGMYVSAAEFTFYPFTNIFTRISGDDNIFRGQSSFAVEMTELRSILKNADNRSLVIGDEVCRGTENLSGLAIVAATIKKFSANNVKFIFTSHLHKLTNIKEIINLNNINFYHLSVNIDNNTNDLVYVRKLEPGSGITKYGLEVAKCLIKDNDFINDAYFIRNNLMDFSDKILNHKESKYNSDVYINECQICGKNKKQAQLDVHHIKFQSMCNENGLIGHIPKNVKSNLVILCKKHHNDVHHHNLIINSYKMTLDKGKVLDYQYVDNSMKSKKRKYDESNVKIMMGYKNYKEMGLTKTGVLKKLKNENSISTSFKTLDKIWNNKYFN